MHYITKYQSKCHLHRPSTLQHFWNLRFFGIPNSKFKIKTQSNRHSRTLTSVEACLHVGLKSDSGSGGRAAGRTRRYHLKHSAHHSQTSRPNGWEDGEDTGVGVFGMCWRRGAGVHVPIWGRLSWRWTQVCGYEIIGAWGAARGRFCVIWAGCSLDKMKRPNQLLDGQESCAISWPTWTCNAMPSLRAGETVTRPAIMLTPVMQNT